MGNEVREGVNTQVKVPSGGDRRKPQRLSSWQRDCYSDKLYNVSKLQIPEAADSCRLSAGWGCFTSFFGRILKCPFLFSNKFI